MTTFLRPRLGVLTTLRAQSGTLVAYVPREDVLALTTPDMLDGTGTGTLVVRANSAAASALTVSRVVEIVDWASPGVVARTEEWRLLTRRVVDGAAAGGDAGTVTCTLVRPLADWPDAGRLVAWNADGVPSWDLSGAYTPAEALALALDHLATHDQGHWTAGTIDRTDARDLAIVDLDAAQLRELIQSTWALEPVVTRTSDTVWTLDLRTKREATANVPTLRATGALESVDWTQDGVPLATAVLPIGADGATIAHAGWTVASVDTGTDVVGLIDGGGGPGPIQADGQLVGAYLQAVDGTRVAITATLVNDGTTSLVTVTDAAAFSAGSAGVPADVVEFRSDSAGAKCVILTDPAAVAAYRYREVPVERSDLAGGRNFVPNPRGADYQTTTTAPDGWAIDTDHSAAIDRLTSGYPAGCPAGDPGYMWRWTTTWPGQVLTAPLTPAIDPVTSDEEVCFAVLIYVDYDLASVGNGSGDTFVPPKPTVNLRDGSGTLLATETAGADGGQTWLTLGADGLTLAALARCQVELTFTDGEVQPASGAPYAYTVGDITGGVATYIAVAQVTRTSVALDWTDGSPVNLLHQAGAAHLAAHCTPEDRLAITAADYAVSHPAAFSDVPIVTGGDIQLRADTIGLDTRVRVLGATRNRLAPTPPTLDVVAAPDPTVAALLGAAAPTRQRDILDIIREVSGRASGSTSTTSSSTSASGVTAADLAPLILAKGLTRVDPEYYGADPTGVTECTDILLNILATYRELRVRAGATFRTRRIRVVGTGTLDTSHAVKVWGGGRLLLDDNQDTELLWLEECYWSVVEDVVLDGNKTNQTLGSASAVILRNQAYTQVRGVRVLNSCAHGIAVENWSAVVGGASTMADELNLTDTFVLFSNNDGVQLRSSGTSIQSPGDLTIQGCHINANGGHGLRTDASYFTKVMGGEYLSNGSAGIVMTYGAGCELNGLTARNNGTEGIWLQNASDYLLTAVTSHYNNAGAGTGVGLLAETCTDLAVVGGKFHDTAFTTRSYRPLKATNCADLMLRSTRFAVGTAGTAGADVYGTAGLYLDATTVATYSARDCLGITDTP